MRLLNSLILLLLAITLAVILLPIGFLLESILKYKGQGTADYWYKVARSIDQHGNAVCGLLFSFLFVNQKNRDYKLHGDEDKTVSYVLAHNKATSNLSFCGLGLYNLLEKLDPGHGERALLND